MYLFACRKQELYNRVEKGFKRHEQIKCLVLFDFIALLDGKMYLSQIHGIVFDFDGVETLWEKEKMLVSAIFSFSLSLSLSLSLSVSLSLSPGSLEIRKLLVSGILAFSPFLTMFSHLSLSLSLSVCLSLRDR